MKKCNLILGVLLVLTVTTKATATDVMENPTESVIENPVATPGGIDITDEVTLDAVTNLTTCSLDKNKVRLTWEAVEGADYYHVTRTNLKGKSRTELAQVKKCTFTDTTLTYNKDYIYYVTPVKRIDTEVNGSTEITLLEGAKSEIIFSNKRVVATDHQKYSYVEMEDDIELLYEKYNGLIGYSVVGQSADGRRIYDVIIGNPKAQKSFLVVSTLHAREYMCSLLTMNQIEYYLENYNKSIHGKKVADILEEICIHYIPMANPDGVSISQEGFDAIKNDTLRDKLEKMGGNTIRWKANARGVDLNRNFPFDFEERGTRGAEGYSGATEASEPEVKAVVKLTKSLKKRNGLQAVVNYHSMGSIIFGGVAGCSEGVATDVKRMYKDAQSVTGYTDALKYSKDTLKGSNGNSKEYYNCVLELPSITIEIGRQAAPGPIEEFPAIWNENKDVVIRQAALFCGR